MTTFYNHQAIEKKWQREWEKEKLELADDKSKKCKKYILDMFPYPSGEGLHVGHVESYTATDIISRYLRMKGYNVLHPQGWDAFGLPAENYAIKTGAHPQETTQKAIVNFKRQIKSIGLAYDWTREINTSSPDYYRWTQWLFLQLYKKGLAYKKKAPVNWCPSCQTVLANEQVKEGRCERCESVVIQKDLEQWFFKLTNYAEELLAKIDEMDWPEPLKHAQKNWIGRSEGAIIEFRISNFEFRIKVFTTRPDTLFGATYLVLAPEHPLLQNKELRIMNNAEVEEYINQSRKKNQLERTDLNKEKTGVELKGIKAINPATKKEIPVWVADYVMMGYGTGAIMAVPGHDERDWEFAKKYNLEIVEVVKSESRSTLGAYQGEGILINSGKFNGLTSEEAREKITKFVKGKKQVQYKIRDWLISRQRYWGAPIPIIYCRKCWESSKFQIPSNKQIANSNNQNSRIISTIIDGEECAVIPVPEKNLPVLLPTDVDFKPTGESPLAWSKEFHNVKCPKCGGQARRESDTLDTFVCSSWYFLRYVDSHNQKEPFSKKSVKYWLPVDLYIGGMEHAVGHLIYARFITKVLRDLGYLKFDEPFLKIRNQGIILAEDSRKMSKRWGNVINPDEVVEEYGADTLRMYEMFMGPLEDSKPWSQKGIIGIRRFLEKVYKLISNFEIRISRLNQNSKFEIQSSGIERLLHKTIKKITEDIENLHFNTAISAMMIFMNKISNLQTPTSKNIFEKFLIILAPFAPHLAEELWSSLGHAKSIFLEKWPAYDKNLVIDEQITIAIQINGKLRGTIITERGISEEDLRSMTYDLPNIKKYLSGKEIKKFIYIKDKLVNIVV